MVPGSDDSAAEPQQLQLFTLDNYLRWVNRLPPSNQVEEPEVTFQSKRKISVRLYSGKLSRVNPLITYQHFLRHYRDATAYPSTDLRKQLRTHVGRRVALHDIAVPVNQTYAAHGGIV